MAEYSCRDRGGKHERAGTFQVALSPEDWRSGETVWLLDVVAEPRKQRAAADRKQATSVLANFRQLAGQRPVRIHPLVARLIEPEVLERLRGASIDKRND